MPKCPKCGKEIDHLIFDGCERMTAKVELNSVDMVDYVDWDSFGFDENSEYKCPECGAVLFTDEEDAGAFLRGELKDSQQKTA